MKSIRELELEITRISHQINYLQGMLYSTTNNKDRNKILNEIQDLECKQKEYANELKYSYKCRK